MNNFQKWLVDLTGEESLWIIELFLIVLVALSLGYILNRVIDRLEAHAAKTKTVWDDAFIGPIKGAKKGHFKMPLFL